MAIKDKIKKAKEKIEELDVSEEELNKQSVDPHLNDLLRLRKQLRGFIRQAEKELKTYFNQRNAYTLLALYTQYKETIADIRAIEDQNRYAEVVTEQVISPLVSQIFQNYSDTLFHQQKLLRDQISRESYDIIKERNERLFTEHGRFLQDAQKQALAKLDEIFSDKS